MKIKKSQLLTSLVTIATIIIIFGDLFIPGCSCENQKRRETTIKLEPGQKVVSFSYSNGYGTILTEEMGPEDKPRTLKTYFYFLRDGKDYDKDPFEELTIEERR